MQSTEGDVESGSSSLAPTSPSDLDDKSNKPAYKSLTILPPESRATLDRLSIKDASETAAHLKHLPRFDTASRIQSWKSVVMEDEKTHYDYKQTVTLLDQHYRRVKRLILRHQSPTIGLFPRFGGEDSTVGYVRDTIYCSYTVWALYQAYKRIDDDRGRTYELGQSAVKSMRGVLYCWMKQANKVEEFKYQQRAAVALHSRFNVISGEIIHDAYDEHLQIDCIALWLIATVQMITSGLEIIYTMDEVNFVQNLVYYIERAYRTPDYGMWERGSRYNNGQCELHASSIGMTKAALEAVNGINIFGDHGTSSSVIYVDIDAYNRNRITFETLLPRESASKNVDASLLPTMSFPCFAVHDDELKAKTFSKISRKLQGSYGLKRFLRDGYKTALEDSRRRYYESGETKNFANIECEWPMFYIYYLIDAYFTNNMEQAKEYQQLLEPLLKILESKSYSDMVVPHYYYIPEAMVEEERTCPGQVYRKSSREWMKGHTFLWAQGLYIISQLLGDGLLHINELDPIRRYLPASERPRKSIRYSFFQGSASDLVIQVAIISESMRLQSLLATYGIQAQTPHQVEPIQIWSPKELVKVFEHLAVNKRMNLTGRPPRPIGILGTSKIYRVGGTMVLCYPLNFEQSDFYLTYDMKRVIEDLKADLIFLSRAWKLAGRPTFCMLIREDSVRSGEFNEMLKLLAQFKKGEMSGIQIRLGRLQNLIGTACIEHLDFFSAVSFGNNEMKQFEEITDYRIEGYKSLTDVPKAGKRHSEASFNIKHIQTKTTPEILDLLRQTDSMREQADVLKVLADREGLSYCYNDETVKEMLEKLYRQAGQMRHWYVVRYAACTLNKLVDSLMPSITSILVRGKQLTIGVFGHEEKVIDKPVTPAQMQDIIFSHCSPYHPIEAVLQQEVILAIAKIISSDVSIFYGILKIRIGWILHAMDLELSLMESDEPLNMYSLSPSSIKSLLYKVLTVRHSEDGKGRSTHEKRQLDGALCRVPRDFYEQVWLVLCKTEGGLIVAGHHMPQQPTISELTLYELNFSLEVEQLLSRISDPAYRQLMVELFVVVATILKRNPEVQFVKTVDMDHLIKQAYHEFQHDRQQPPDKEMTDFLNTPPSVQKGTTSYLTKAVVNSLMQSDIKALHATEDGCPIS